jgi:hypothetical protein
MPKSLGNLVSCTDLDKGDVIAQLTKITAVEVGELSNVPI